MHKPRLLEQLRQEMRTRHYARKTEQAYVSWVKRYVRFHNLRHPAEMGAEDIAAFLSYLAVNRQVSGSTQNQALNALVFLYKHVLGVEPGELSGLIRAKTGTHLPEVFTLEEISRIFKLLDNRYWLMACLIYGGGLRVRECLQLRVKDIDFDQCQLHVRDSKGRRDRVTIFPKYLKQHLRDQLKRVEQLHQKDLSNGLGRAPLPFALERKYPGLDKSWSWQFVFPSRQISVNDRTGLRCRHHTSESGIQRAFRTAMRRAEVIKHASCHNLRHSFATHMLLNNYDIRTVQTLLGHKNVKTTMVYLQLAKDLRGIESPAELLDGSRELNGNAAQKAKQDSAAKACAKTPWHELTQPAKRLIRFLVALFAR